MDLLLSCSHWLWVSCDGHPSLTWLPPKIPFRDWTVSQDNMLRESILLYINVHEMSCPTCTSPLPHSLSEVLWSCSSTLKSPFLLWVTGAIALRAVCAVSRKGKINIAIACSLNYFCAHGLFPVRFLADAGIGALGFEKTNKPRLWST